MNPEKTYGDDQIDDIFKLILEAEKKKENNPGLNIVKRNPPINLSMPQKKCGMKIMNY